MFRPVNNSAPAQMTAFFQLSCRQQPRGRTQPRGRNGGDNVFDNTLVDNQLVDHTWCDAARGHVCASCMTTCAWLVSKFPRQQHVASRKKKPPTLHNSSSEPHQPTNQPHKQAGKCGAGVLTRVIAPPTPSLTRSLLSTSQELQSTTPK